MRFMRVTLFLMALLLLVWVNVPMVIPVKFAIGSVKVDTVLRPPSINTKLFGLEIKKEFVNKLGLDLSGGSHMVFQADISKIKKEDLVDSLESARNTIERRVNMFGVAEPQVQTIKSGGSYRIAVDLPGVQDTAQAARLIGQTAQLTFREELATYPANLATAPAYFRLVRGNETGITGEHIKKASVKPNPETGKPDVVLEFTPEGGDLFAEATGRNIGKPLGIFLDFQMLSYPTVSSRIEGGIATITGDFTYEEAKQYALAINSGSLPIPVKLIEQKTIGPSLGAQEVRLAVFAGGLGLGMVMFFMIAYYGRMGLIACLCLIIYGLISNAIFKFIPIVLTLPGVAGFILSIGMAVDTNILIFERIKEETRKGREFQSAINAGFGRAIDAIKDANITTLIVAFILFNPSNWDFLPQFGLVRGFALTLAIGVAVSLFTGIVINKRLIQFFFGRKHSKSRK